VTRRKEREEREESKRGRKVKTESGRESKEKGRGREKTQIISCIPIFGFLEVCLAPCVT